MRWETGEGAQLSGSGRKTEIICCENLPAMRIFMRYGVDFNHEAIRGKTPQEKDEQVVASHFPEGDYIRLSFKSKVHCKVLGSFLRVYL